MEFGTFVLSEKASIYSDSIRSSVGNSSVEIHLLRLAKFIYQRPDTNEMILEVEGFLIQDKPENVYIFNKDSVEYFKQKIKSMMEQRIVKVDEEIKGKRNMLGIVQTRDSELQDKIDLLAERQEKEPTVGREKQIQGLLKNQRKIQRRMNALKTSIQEHQIRIENIRNEIELSLSMVENNIKMPK
ncbi:hypothetical protein ACFVS2_20145 [Brevibacillus sp. NPDC058079]|uniref:hypothetical protein n=1 Tax=Brevibacillus sp. NPDC058079 TaxID=3346330 RepID=UPI0036EE81A2